MKKKDILLSESAYTTALLAALIDEFTIDFTNWLPATIELEIQRTFNIKLPEINKQKIYAGIRLLTTDAFYWSLPDFVEICQILNNVAILPEVFSLPDLEDCVWGLVESTIINPPDRENLGDNFSKEIKLFLGKTIEWSGIARGEKLIPFAIFSDRPKTYREVIDDPAVLEVFETLDSQTVEEIEAKIKQNLVELFKQVLSLEYNNIDSERFLALKRRLLPFLGEDLDPDLTSRRVKPTLYKEIHQKLLGASEIFNFGANPK